MHKSFKIISLFSFIFLFGFLPQKAFGWMYSVSSPGDPVEVTCLVGNDTCKWEGNVVFNNDAGAPIIKSTVWTEDDENILFYKDEQGNWTAGTNDFYQRVGFQEQLVVRTKIINSPSLWENGNENGEDEELQGPQIGVHNTKLCITGEEEVSDDENLIVGEDKPTCLNLRLVLVDAPTDTPTPTPTITPTPTFTPTPTLWPTYTPTPTPTLAYSPSLSPTPTPTPVLFTPINTPTQSPVQLTPTLTPTPTLTQPANNQDASTIQTAAGASDSGLVVNMTETPTPTLISMASNFDDPEITPVINTGQVLGTTTQAKQTNYLKIALLFFCGVVIIGGSSYLFFRH